MRKFAEPRLLVATHNAGKLEEVRQLLSALELDVISARELGLPEPDETESTFVGNARIKAHAAAKAAQVPALADDSGIEVEALDGAPGVYTADWAETPNGRDFLQAMTRTWRALEDKGTAHPRRARFCCTLVLAWPDGHDEVFTGTVDGHLVWPPRGVLGHGYDPMFVPVGSELTFAEMTANEKNAISHRSVALRNLIADCFT
jgi:XTP/dITP diphosphohydrolase